MANGRDDEHGLLGGVRRAVGDAFDATVGRVGQTVGDAAMDVTGATAQQVIEDLEPYLVQEAIPRIVAGITPYLSETVVPEVLEGIHEHLVEVTIPDVVDGVTSHLVAVTVPEVVDGVTPRLVEDLLPRLLEDLRPYLEAELVPRIVDALLPQISETVAPDLIEALMPTIEQDVAPRLVDALMPKIEQEVAPQLVDALLPKIRHEVVPTILDDIIEDPRIRDLIREQSQGLFLDALESLRENLADLDDVTERFGRRILRQPARPPAESAVSMVMEATGRGQVTAIHTFEALAERREVWNSSPMPPAPPGREFAFAGAVTRLVGFGIDVTLVGWLISQGLSAIVGLLDSLFDPIPAWLTVILSGIAASLVPVYLAVSWWFAGRSIGSWLVGTRVCTPDGRNPGFWRALVRSWVGVLGIVIWVLSGVFSLFDAKRRSWLDRLLHTEVRYVVPENQQHRYLREAVQARRVQDRVDRDRVDQDSTTDPDQPAG